MTLSLHQVTKLNDWRAEYGQSVRQQTVRSMTTKDKPGTLPQYVYGIKKTAARPVTFVEVSADGAADGDNTPAEVPVNEDDDTNVVPSNTLMVVAEREACLFLSKDPAKDETGIPCIVLQQYSVNPTTFIVASGLEVVNPGNVKATLVQWEFMNGQDHQDGITISDDMLVDVLSIKDKSDSLLCTELEDMIEGELTEDISHIEMVQTRSG